MIRLVSAALLCAASAAQASTIGLAQSPIDITPQATVFVADLPALGFNYPTSTTLTLFNTGSPDEEATVQGRVAPGAASLTVGGVEYGLIQFHFHVEAEHELDGVLFDGELHLVHQSAAGDLLVVGRFIEAGDENAAFGPFFENLSPVAGVGAVVDDFDLTATLPATLESFRYAGSLTAPPVLGEEAPFPEGVSWVLLAENLILSEAQLEDFAALFEAAGGENRREVQPLNGRQVFTDVEGFVAPAPVPLPAPAGLLALGLVALWGARRRR